MDGARRYAEEVESMVEICQGRLNEAGKVFVKQREWVTEKRKQVKRSLRLYISAGLAHESS